MTVFVHQCGVTLPHAPHVFPIVNQHVPTLVTWVSCKGSD